MSSNANRLLITGAAGRVGQAVLPYLRRRYPLRLLDRLPIPGAAAADEVIVGDLCQPEVARAAVKGCRGVLHLACVHGIEAGFEETLDANYRSLLSVLQACVETGVDTGVGTGVDGCVNTGGDTDLDPTAAAGAEAGAASGVERFVYTSSHHVFGQHLRERFDQNSAVLAPDSFYGLSKVFGEALCGLFAKRYGLRTLLIRLGNADPTVSDARRAALWSGAADLSQLVAIGLEHPDVHLELVYGVSRCLGGLFSNERAEQLGYRPEQDAADHLGADYLSFEAMPATDGPEFVGGAYAARPLPRWSGAGSSTKQDVPQDQGWRLFE